MRSWERLGSIPPSKSALHAVRSTPAWRVSTFAEAHGIRRRIEVLIERDDGSTFDASNLAAGAYLLSARFVEPGMSAAQALDIRFEVLDATRALSQTMYAEVWARGFGLPEACLIVVRQFVGRPLYSSSNDSREWWLPSEMIAPAARKVWNRLVALGIATPVGSSERIRIS